MIDLLTPTATFANALQQPAVLDGRSGGRFHLQAVQVQVDLGLGTDADGAPLLTDMWTYQWVDEHGHHSGGSGMGAMAMPTSGNPGQGSPTLLASSGVPLSVTWSNGLPDEHLIPVDDSILHGMGVSGSSMSAMAMPAGGHDSMAGMHGAPMDGDDREIPIVTHLHGGHTAAIYDGYPTDGIAQGDAPVTYTYDNDQPGALLWYHDHSMGLTRLNVYAGLAGTYVIEDENRRALVASGVLPETLGAHHATLLVQDKSFTADGKLYYPGASPDDPLPGTSDTVKDVLPPDYKGGFPTAVPEYYGNVLLVNGQAWPHADVGRGQVEYDLVNGSDSRFYVLKLDNPWVKVTLLGVDGGLLHKPVTLMDGDGVDEAGEQVVFAPADRLQLLFDFSDPHIGSDEKVHLLNAGPAYEPFKGLLPDGSLEPGHDEMGAPAPVQAATPADPVGEIMEFRVKDSVPAWHSTLTPDTVLNPDLHLPDEADATVTRRLGIFEVKDEHDRTMPMVGVAEATTDIAGNMIDGVANPLARGFDTPVTEVVKLGSTEVWEFFNATEDAHPVHVHLGQFKVLGRYHISATDTDGDGITLGDDGYQNDLGALVDTRDDLPGIQNLYPEDTGAQDTVWLGPGEALKIAMTFDRPGDYVWHCHILSHEDHDMMRPFKVVGIAGDFAAVVDEDSGRSAKGLLEIGEVDPLQQGFRPETLLGQFGTLRLASNIVLDHNAAGEWVDPVHGNNGEWTYTLSCGAQALGAGETVVEHFTIHELDGNALDLTVTVQGENDAPVVCGLADLGHLGGPGPVTITEAQLLSTSRDVDRTDHLSVDDLRASSGHLVDNGDGTWTFTPDQSSQGPVTFAYDISDGHVEVAATAGFDVPDAGPCGCGGNDRDPDDDRHGADGHHGSGHPGSHGGVMAHHGGSVEDGASASGHGHGVGGATPFSLSDMVMGGPFGHDTLRDFAGALHAAGADGQGGHGGHDHGGGDWGFTVHDDDVPHGTEVAMDGMTMAEGAWGARDDEDADHGGFGTGGFGTGGVHDGLMA